MTQDKVVRLDPAVDGVEAVTEQRASYVHTAVEAIRKRPSSKGRCEFVYKSEARRNDTCTRFVKFWVQRGPVGILVCGGHLQAAVTELHELRPGRYGCNEHYEGYWIRATAPVIVKMKVGEGWR